MVDKRKSSEYKELRGFISIALIMEFKAACKKIGQDINNVLQEAVRDWIDKQEKSTDIGYQKVVSFHDSNFSQEDLIFSSLPSISTAIEKTLENPEWGLKHLASQTKISVNRLKKLISGDRPTNEEITKLAGCLMKVDGFTFDEEELTDMRIASELKQRQLARLKKRQNKDKS